MFLEGNVKLEHSRERRGQSHFLEAVSLVPLCNFSKVLNSYLRKKWRNEKLEEFFCMIYRHRTALSNYSGGGMHVKLLIFNSSTIEDICELLVVDGLFSFWSGTLDVKPLAYWLVMVVTGK